MDIVNSVSPVLNISEVPERTRLLVRIPGIVHALVARVRPPQTYRSRRDRSKGYDPVSKVPRLEPDIRSLTYRIRIRAPRLIHKWRTNNVDSLTVAQRVSSAGKNGTTPRTLAPVPCR